jgi:cell division transport system permease protein
MRLTYLIKTTGKHFRRAWMSSLLSIFSIAFFLVLIGFFGLISLNISHLLMSLSSQVQIHAYVSNALDERDTTELQSRLEAISGVERVEYISKAEAAKTFQGEFGKELFDILKDNPLPASFVVYVNNQQRTESGIRAVAERAQVVTGIDDVVYHVKTLALLNRYGSIAVKVNGALLIFVTMGSLFLIANHLRLVIGAQKQIISTMRLVGATAGFIRLPLLVEGLLQGVLGGVLALLVLQVGVIYLTSGLPGFALQGMEYGGVLLLLGVLFGFIGSLLGLKRYL